MATATRRRIAPGPNTRGVVGDLPAFRRDPLAFFTRGMRVYGDIVRFRAGPRIIHLVTHPDHVQWVLQQNNKNYRKGWSFRKAKSFIGEGLLTSEGEFWLRQRRLAQPAFHRQRIAEFATLMTDTIARMLEDWDERCRLGRPVNVADEMMKLTLTIVAKALFGADVSTDAPAVSHALTVALEHTNQRINSIVDVPLRVPTPANRRFLKALDTLDSIVYRVIEERRRTETGETGDLLSMLLHAVDEETGATMDDRQLRDEVMTILLAGHETTASSLAWTYYYLSKYPDIDLKLHEEVRQVIGDRTPTADDYPNLRYTGMVFSETLRITPPIWGTSRDALGDDEIGGYHIPKGSELAVIPYVTHRHPAFWHNPEAYIPERFTPEQVTKRPRYAYIPFGGGPRICIGNNFALLEAHLTLAMVAQKFHLQLAPGYQVHYDATATLRPKPGVLMTLHKV